MSKNNFDLAAIAGSVASNVGAAAASAASSLAQQGAKALSGEGHFFDETVTVSIVCRLALRGPTILFPVLDLLGLDRRSASMRLRLRQAVAG